MSALAEASALLFAEAAALDERRWEDWLALFTEDCLYHVPAWRDEVTPTTDPRTEISIIHCAGRAQLAERVQRITGGRSVASLPPPRTAHVVGNVMLVEASDAALRVKSVWASHVFNVKRQDQHVFFSRVEHTLVRQDGAWRIARRHALLLNDRLPTMLDIYSL
jgi:3-phenylpropionate/cinnamic acid dioxygenase small subunit